MDMRTGTAAVAPGGVAPGGNRRTVRRHGPPRRAGALTCARERVLRGTAVGVHGSRAAHHRQEAAARLLRGGGGGAPGRRAQPPAEWLPGREATAPLTTRPCVTRRSALRRST